jgi:HK97 family phage portal protein
MGFWGRLGHKLLGIDENDLQVREFNLLDPAAGRLFGRMGDSPPRRGTEQLLEALNELPRFRSVTNRIATSVACTKWRAFRTKGDMFQRRAVLDQIRTVDYSARNRFIRDLNDAGQMQEIDSHPMLDALLRPTPEHTARQRQILSQTWMDVVGEAFWLVERGEKGNPFEFWPIPPSWVKRVPSTLARFSSGATDAFPDFEIQTSGGNARIRRDDMIWFRDPDPADPYGRGTGFGHALNDELDIEEYATKTAAARFWNQAIPNYILMIEGADEKELRRLQTELDDKHRGWKRSHRPKLTSGKIQVEKLDVSFVDLQMVEQRKYETQVICQTFGIPPEILGIIENSNRSTIDAADFIFSLYLQVPRLDFWEDQYNQRIAPLFGGDIVMLYESPVPEDWEFIIQHMAAHPYAFSLDELRDIIDFEPLKNGNGYLHPIKAGWQMSEIEKDVGKMEEKPTNQNEEGARDDEARGLQLL